MKVSSWITQLLGWLGAALVATLQVQVLGLEHFLHQRRQARPVVFAAWHEQLALLAHQGGKYHLAVLIATGRDGDLGVGLARGLGVVPLQVDVRRQPLKGLQRLRSALQQGQDVVLFADGPLGPPRKARPGALRLAQSTGSPLLPVAAVTNWGVRLASWDRLYLPLPFARVVVAVGEALPVGADEALLASVLGVLENRAREAL